MTYDNISNITSKSDVGTYCYGSGNVLTSITDYGRTIVTRDEIGYNSFDKITQMVSDGYTMLIEYGPMKSRVLSDIQGLRRYYVDNLFEEEGCKRQISYINYIFALVRLSPSSHRMLMVLVMSNIYIMTIGSIQAYSDELGKLYQELSYDAWG